MKSTIPSGTVSGTDLSSTEYGDLLAIPRLDESSDFVGYWLGKLYDFGSVWYVGQDCVVNASDSLGFGVRPVVLLVPEVKFSASSTKINGTTTWEISLDD